MKTSNPSKSSQTRWEQHHNTFTPSIPTSCAILCNKKTLYTSLNEHGTKHCTAHSTAFHINISESDSARFSSNKIPQHNLELSTYHTDPAERLLILAVLNSNYIHCIHAPTTYTTHPAYIPLIPTTFHNPAMHTTNKHKKYS